MIDPERPEDKPPWDTHCARRHEPWSRCVYLNANAKAGAWFCSRYKTKLGTDVPPKRCKKCLEAGKKTP